MDVEQRLSLDFLRSSVNCKSGGPSSTFPFSKIADVTQLDGFAVKKIRNFHIYKHASEKWCITLIRKVNGATHINLTGVKSPIFNDECIRKFMCTLLRSRIIEPEEVVAVPLKTDCITCRFHFSTQKNLFLISAHLSLSKNFVVAYYPEKFCGITVRHVALGSCVIHRTCVLTFTKSFTAAQKLLAELARWGNISVPIA